VGQSALRIADMAGIALPPGQERILLVPVQYVGPEYPFSTEKLSPVLAFYVRPTFAACIETAAEILNTGGRGHTAAIHAENRNAVMQFAAKMKVSRVIVNQTSATSAGGSRFNGLVPTTTLGCGTWGNNVSTDNISVRHVLNIKRVAFKQAEARDTSRVFEDS
jgi:acyl-CoA reductase-like NAD-dependent aldehyde dehydrogenase